MGCSESPTEVRAKTHRFAGEDRRIEISINKTTYMTLDTILVTVHNHGNSKLVFGLSTIGLQRRTADGRDWRPYEAMSIIPSYSADPGDSVQIYAFRILSEPGGIYRVQLTEISFVREVGDLLEATEVMAPVYTVEFGIVKVD